MKRIEHKACEDDSKPLFSPSHHQSNNTSTSTTASPSHPSSTTGVNKLLSTSPSDVAHGSPIASSIGSVSSLSVSSPPSTVSMPSLSNSHCVQAPQLQLLSDTPSPSPPHSLSSVRGTCSSASQVGSTFSGTCDVHQAVTSRISDQAQLDVQEEQSAPKVPVESVASDVPENWNGIENTSSDQNGVQSPPSDAGSIFSTSSADSGVLLLPTQRNSSNDGSLSSDNFSPYHSPTSTDDFTHPSSVLSPGMGTSLHSSVSTDSIPSTTGSIPFQASNISDSVPGAPSLSDVFNTQIPSHFNFSTNESPYDPQNISSSDFVSGLDFSLLDPPHFNTPSGTQTNPGDAMLQHLLGEILALNNDSAVPGNGNGNGTSSTSCTSAPFQGTYSCTFVYVGKNGGGLSVLILRKAIQMNCIKFVVFSVT